MEKLSALDASFLQLETPSAHMHVGWVSYLAAEDGLDLERLLGQVEERLPAVPRFAQRVSWPSSLLDPVWVDDPGFDPRAHVGLVRGPARASRAHVARSADVFLGRPLDRERPLWELLLAPRLRSGGAALAGKVHHAMVDGMAAVELGMLLFDASAEAPAARGVPRSRALTVPATPPSVPPPGRVLAAAATDTALEQFRLARGVVSAGRHPRDTVRLAGTLRRAAFSLAGDLITNPAPRSPLNRTLGPRRALHTARLPLERLLKLRTKAGVKLNDIVLALATSALARFAAEIGDPVPSLRAMVPVNTRAEGTAGDGGNRIAFAFVDLPLGERRPGRRLDVVARRMRSLKSDGSIGGSDALLRGLAGVPAPLRAQVARAAASPRAYNLVISNVPGPRIPLFAAGARVREIYPVIPLSAGHALALGVLTYDGFAHFAWHADPDALPLARRLPGLLTSACEELAGVLGA